jgi:hypothetical protein
VRTQRRVLLCLAAATALIAALQGITGIVELTLYAAPVLLLVGLLLSGRFVGERALLARRQAALPRLRAVLRRRWPRTRERALASLLERSAERLRGPPALAAARC